MSKDGRTRFVQRRKAAGLTQDQLADSRGRPEHGGEAERAETEPHPSVRSMLALKLGVTLDELDDLLSHQATVGHRHRRRRDAASGKVETAGGGHEVT